MTKLVRKQPTFLSFWAINDRLDIHRLKQQIDEIKRLGLDGVIFHPRNYPNEPEYLGTAYMNILSELIMYAKSVDMVFWIYDENGWPSGTAGGKVLADMPDLTCQWVEWRNEQAVLRSKKAVSSLDARATAYFIEITHEAYKRKLTPEAFEYVTGFFSDEVAFLDGHSVSHHYGAVPWSDRVPVRYKEAYGEDLEPHLPLLFTEGSGYQQVRARYWELLTDELVDSFYKPIHDWCLANGKEFTAHLKAEENPLFQLSYSGSCFHVLRNVSVPAIDALERHPGNHYYPRIAHSVAAQAGMDEVLVEAIGGSGWGLKPEDFTAYMLWLSGHGLNTFVLHLNQYRLNSSAVRDWPPSHPFHLTWKEALPSVLFNIKERIAQQPDPRREAELLIITPTRGIMAEFAPYEAIVFNEHDGSGIPDTTKSGRMNNEFLRLVEACHQAGIHYELTEERAVEELGVVEGSSLRIGQRLYGEILVSDSCRWNERGAAMMNQLSELGAVILSPEHIKPAFDHSKGEETHDLHEEDNLNQALVPEQSAWHVGMPKSNLYVIEMISDGLSKLHAEFQLEQVEEHMNLELLCLDEVAQLSINGEVLSGTYIEDRFIYCLTSEQLRSGANSLNIIVKQDGEQLPIVFLRGEFVVISRAPYEPKDEHQLRVKGDFILKTMCDLYGDDLIQSGLPFNENPVTFTTTIHLDQIIRAGKLRLSDIHANAARVWVDQEELGWCWEPDWAVTLTKDLQEGEHLVTVQLIPSTYNVFGPHRHIDGDRHLTSPDQYKGIKNFADRQDAPENTLGDDWHFVRCGMKGKLGFIQ